MSARIWAYCETPLHVRAAIRVHEALAGRTRFQLVLGGWSDEVGQAEASRQSGVEATPIAVDANFAAARAEQRWAEIAGKVGALVAGGDIFLAFQDQHFHAQAAIAGARAAGARIALAQDGFLDFDMNVVPFYWRALWPLVRALDRGPRRAEPRLRGLMYERLYARHFFGHTRPDHVFVFGPRLARRLSAQFGIAATAITAAGPLLGSFEPAPTPRSLQAPGRLSVLFISQCALRYQRMSEGTWRARYLTALRALRGTALCVKLHPAQTEHEERDIRAAAGPAAEIRDRAPLTPAEIERHDLAVTMSSTAFIDCIAAGVPVIFLDIQGSLDRMPNIKHPLLCNVRSAADLQHAVSARLSGTFAGNAAGAPLSEVLAHGGGAAAVAEGLLRLGRGA